MICFLGRKKKDEKTFSIDWNKHAYFYDYTARTYEYVLLKGEEYGDLDGEWYSVPMYRGQSKLQSDQQRLMAEAKAENSAAWKCRGGGYVGKVTEEGWKGFYEHLGKATNLLEQAYRLHPELPETSALMMEVKAPIDKDAMNTWFDRVLALEVDNPDAWQTLMFYSLPRWWGSVQDLRDLSAILATITRKERDVFWRNTDSSAAATYRSLFHVGMTMSMSAKAQISPLRGRAGVPKTVTPAGTYTFTLTKDSTSPDTPVTGSPQNTGGT